MKYMRLKAFKKIRQFHFIVSLIKMFFKSIVPREPGSYLLLNYLMNQSCQVVSIPAPGALLTVWFLGLSRSSMCSMWQFGHHTMLGEEPVVLATGLSINECASPPQRPSARSVPMEVESLWDLMIQQLVSGLCCILSFS